MSLTITCSTMHHILTLPRPLVLLRSRETFHHHASTHAQLKIEQALAVRVLDRLVAGADEDAFELGEEQNGGDRSIGEIGGIDTRSGSISVRVAQLFWL